MASELISSPVRQSAASVASNHKPSWWDVHTFWTYIISTVSCRCRFLSYLWKYLLADNSWQAKLHLYKDLKDLNLMFSSVPIHRNGLPPIPLKITWYNFCSEGPTYMLYFWRSGTSQLVFPSVSKRPFLLTWEIPVVQMILEIVEQGSEISRLVLSAAPRGCPCLKKCIDESRKKYITKTQK